MLHNGIGTQTETLREGHAMRVELSYGKGSLPLRWEAEEFASDNPRQAAVHDEVEAFTA